MQKLHNDHCDVSLSTENLEFFLPGYFWRLEMGFAAGCCTEIFCYTTAFPLLPSFDFTIELENPTLL